MQKSETINELAAALAKAQGQIQDAKKDSDNPFLHSKYADLAAIWGACRKPLSDNGLAVVQTISIEDGKRVLESTLFHSSGQWLSSILDLMPKEETSQAVGSAISYMRRYALAALVGVCAADDDGEASMARGQVAKPIVQKPAPQPTSTPQTANKPPTSKPTSESQASAAQGAEPKLGDKASPEMLSQITKNPLLAEALKCETGGKLAVFAGKHGIDVDHFIRIVGFLPTQIVDVAAAAKVLFG